MNEAQIKAALIAKLEKSKGTCPTAIIKELFVGNFSRRADIVVANGILSAFEIKSERDSLSRLSGQVAVYCKFFEKTTIVCAEKHILGVEQTVPLSVGIWKICPKGNITVVRKSARVEQGIKENWLSFLPVVELRSLLRAHLMPTSGCREILVSRAEMICVKKIRSHVLVFLKNRDVRIKEISEKRRYAGRCEFFDLALNDDRVQRYLNSTAVNVVAIPRQVS